MKKSIYSLLTAFVICALSVPAAMAAKTQPQTWEVIIPAGVVQKASINPAPRLTSLTGKTVVLRWNGKHNGDIYADRIAENLLAKEPTVKIIKVHQVDPSTSKISSTLAEATRISKVILELKPDLVIANQAD